MLLHFWEIVFRKRGAGPMIPIEETVFSRKRWIESKMLAYGFHKANKTYILEKPFLDGDFKTVLSVTPKDR